MIAAVNGGSASASFTIPANSPVGMFQIQAVYSGAGQFTAASDSTKFLTIGKATPTITWANPADISAGTSLGPAQLNATANVPGTFTYAPQAGTILPVGNGQTLSVLFTPTDTADYNTAAKSVSINVKPAVPGVLSITSFQLVGTQAADGGNVLLTYRADLVNPGGALDSVTATVTSLDPFTIRVIPGQGALIFKPVPANSQITSGNTFTILTNPNVPLDPSKLLFSFQTSAATPVANPGPNQTVKLGSVVTLDATGSSNPSGIGTPTYNWMFTSRPPWTKTDLFYNNGPVVTFAADAVGAFTLQLTVSNGAASNTASVTINVIP